MVPVELKLSNFLSYGADPQILDFTQFHVACLSGKNGQGKSALLDAITWVLWGEARKSSGGHKPDDELLRIGARRMQVELVFDVESVRYRVMRAYSRSATGKTSKAEMEIQVLDAEGGEGRPVTQSSIRESQHYLNEILGLDYHTFINSAFLLQGRSDEFTKKKPSERKDILGRILNLSKYDRLAAMARDKQRRLAGDIDVQKRESERLTDALVDEPAWKNAQKEVEAELKEKQNLLEEKQQAEADLVEKLGAMDAHANAAASVQASVKQMQEQLASLQQDKGRLEKKIGASEDLVSRAKEIEERYSLHSSLAEEREQLENGWQLFQGIESQLDLKKKALDQYRHEIEQKVREITLDRKRNEERLQEVELAVAQKSKHEADLNAAKAARARVTDLQEQIAKHNQLKEEKAGLDREITGRREGLLSEIKSAKARVEQLSEQLHGREAAEKERARYVEAAKAMEVSTEALERLTKEGQQAGEDIKALEGQLGALEQERTRFLSQIAQLEDDKVSACPTCGTKLTEAHRKETAAQLQGDLEQLDQNIDANQQRILTLAAERDKMRAAYKAEKERADQFAGAPEKVAQLSEQLRGMELLSKENESLMSRVKSAEESLASGAFANDALLRVQEIEELLTAFNLADEVLDKDRYEANQIARYEEHLRNVLLAEGRKEALLATIQGQGQQLLNERKKIDEGPRVKEMQGVIAKLEQQRASSGFDAGRFEAVRKELKELAGAPAQFKDLLDARDSLAEWQEELPVIGERISKIGLDLQQQEEKLAALNAAFTEKPALEKMLAVARGERMEIEEKAKALQMQSGELLARLEQAGKDREALKTCKQSLKGLRAEERIYSKIRRAFSKNGIPSLIIEQALPEIEERTNELLSRLTEGKMRISLETLKDKKTGGTRETLEIIITDEQGVPRPYETFSGGEAFRVNFALRIALAQMLAERSGVRIRTLSIDEGFGTQDDDGIQNLIEALQIIQEDFDKIIVITHLDQLKEAFPVRIEVEKHPVEGSRFTLFQN